MTKKSPGKIKRSVRNVLTPLALSIRDKVTPASDTNLLVLYIFFDRKKYPASFGNLEKILKFCGKNTVLKIDNAAVERKEKRESDRIIEINGDNTFWEFSAWKHALEYARSHLREKFTHVLFVNDAFLNQSEIGRDLVFHSRIFNRYSLEQIDDGVLGIVSSAPGNHVIRGHAINHWLKTSMFCMPYRFAEKLTFASLSPEEIESVVAPWNDGQTISKPNPLMNDEFRAFVDEWLFRRWPGRVKPSPQSWKFLQGKLVAIINERLLTAQVRALGAQVYVSKGGGVLGKTSLSRYGLEKDR